MALTDYKDYISCISEIVNKNNLTNFKRDPNYTPILEHVNSGQGNQYFQLIKNNTSLTQEQINSFCKLNDAQGNPTKVTYGSLQTSPTSLRYIWHAHLILRYMKNSNKNTYDVVEVGGGYGGLCLAVNFFSHLYDIHISSYTIIDLKEAIKLQELYLKNLNVPFPITFIDAATYGSEISKKELFLISNYCFSEISNENQQEYIKILFPKVKCGFMAWNAIPLYDFGFTTRVEEETPKTGEFNKFVYF